MTHLSLSIYIYIYIYTYILQFSNNSATTVCETTRFRSASAGVGSSAVQDSSKGGAVETWCSGLHHTIGCFVI